MRRILEKMREMFLFP